MVMQRWKDFLTVVKLLLKLLQIATDGLKVFGSLPHHILIAPLFIMLKNKGKRKLSSSNQWKMKKSKFRKKKEIRKRNQLNEEQASLFSVFLTGTRVDNL